MKSIHYFLKKKKPKKSKTWHFWNNYCQQHHQKLVVHQHLSLKWLIYYRSCVRAWYYTISNTFLLIKVFYSSFIFFSPFWQSSRKGLWHARQQALNHRGWSVPHCAGTIRFGTQFGGSSLLRRSARSEQRFNLDVVRTQQRYVVQCNSYSTTTIILVRLMSSVMYKDIHR